MTPQERLRHHVTGAIERGEAEPIIEWTAKDSEREMLRLNNRLIEVEAHADALAEALRDCVTSPGALAERSHEYALRRLKTITDTATEALQAYEAAQ